MRHPLRSAATLRAAALLVIVSACGPRFPTSAIPEGAPTTNPASAAGTATSPTVGPSAGATTTTTVIKGSKGSVVTGSIVKIGGLFPKSGGLSALGLPAYQGAAAFFNWANERNLVPGKR